MRGRRAGRHMTRALWEDYPPGVHRSRSDLVSRPDKQAPRLAHRLMFSMPEETMPDKVLKAVQNLCREEFALQHRYAMALHYGRAAPPRPRRPQGDERAGHEAEYL